MRHLALGPRPVKRVRPNDYPDNAELRGLAGRAHARIPGASYATPGTASFKVRRTVPTDRVK